MYEVTRAGKNVKYFKIFQNIFISDLLLSFDIIQTC